MTPTIMEITASGIINHPINTFTGISNLAGSNRTFPYNVKITLKTPYKLARVAPIRARVTVAGALL